tara:strand:+ start:279 stop:503 length:225 start_codon:yes stop_codon:yes gene_type:complete
MPTDEEWRMQCALGMVSRMTVDEFQTELEKYKIECNSIDTYVYDLAKALTKRKSTKNKSNERYVYSLKMESSNE